MNTNVMTEDQLLKIIYQLFGNQVKFNIIEETKDEFIKNLSEVVIKLNTKATRLSSNEFHSKCFSIFYTRYMVNNITPYIKIESTDNDEQ